MEPALPVGAIFSYIKNVLPKWILRRKYPIGRMEKLIHVDIRSRHDSVSINLSPNGNVTVWLQVTNLSPFEIIWDRTDLSLHCGAKIKLINIMPRTIKPYEIIAHPLDSEINSSQAEDIKLNANNGSIYIDGRLAITSAIHSFLKPVSLDGVNPKFINFQIPVKT